jgi:exosortase K
MKYFQKDIILFIGKRFKEKESGLMLTKNSLSNLVLIIILLLLIIFFKLLFNNAKNKDILIFLTPVSTIAGLGTGENFHLDDEKGYVNNNGTIIINRFCSGINYFLIALILSLIVAFPFNAKLKCKIIIICLYFLFCYLLSLTANSSRIIISISVEKLRVLFNWNENGKWFHYLEGIVTFFTFLLLYYLFLMRWVKWNRKMYN